MLALVACRHVPSAAPPPSVTLGWLAGTWVAESDPQTITTEVWLIDGDRLIGKAQTTRGGEVVFTESMFIEQREDGVYYVASPVGQSATAFRMVSNKPNVAIFVNPTHDFPKRIRYRRRGDILVARVVGNKKSSEWRYRRR